MNKELLERYQKFLEFKKEKLKTKIHNDPMPSNTDCFKLGYEMGKIMGVQKIIIHQLNIKLRKLLSLNGVGSK